MSTYVVVLRSRASAVFYPGESFSMNCGMPEGEHCRLTFRTTYDSGYEAPLPKDLWAEAVGVAKDLHHAGELFGNAALEISSIIALAANASMGFLKPELIFDASAERDEHEFLQSFVEDQPLTAVPGRRIDVELLNALVQAFSTHRERQRLLRATAQYVEALAAWHPGREISCLAHLYMGVEALTKACLREHLRKTVRSEQDVAIDWGVDDPDRLKRRKGIESEARRRLIFRGDEICFKKAREISDAFEHGFSDFSEMRKPANEVIVSTAKYLRQAIIELVGIDQALLQLAFDPEYSTPRGPLQLVRYIHGTLLGKAEALAEKGQNYPIMIWRSKLEIVRFDKNRKFAFSSSETLTARLGEGIQFRPTRFEVWDGCSIHESPQPSVDAHEGPSAQTKL